MGNRIFAEYTFPGETNQASAGVGLSWNVFTGTRKTTNEQRSLWTLDKKRMSSLSRAEQEKVVAMLTREFSTLSRLRHPLVLHCTRALETAGDTCHVETEPIFASLANVLKNYKNIQTVPLELQKFHLDPIEIKLGILQVVEALVFLHHSAQIVHLNISPESIVLSPEGSWKLGGLTYASFTNYKDKDQSLFAYPEKDTKEDVPSRASLDYIAPEYVFINRFDQAADMFSLGCLIYELYENKPLLNCRGNLIAYKKAIQTLFPLQLNKVPAQLKTPLEMLLTVDPAKRLTITELLQCEFFNDVPMRVLQYISRIAEKDDRSKSEFFKGLLTTLPNFTPSVLQRRILPVLISELRNSILVPFILPNIFVAAELLDKSIFVSKIFPAILPLFATKEPFQVVLLLLQKLEFLLQRLPAPLINEHVLALVCHALDHDRTEVRIGALKVVPPMFHLFEYERLKSFVLPRLQNFINEAAPAKVNALFAYSKLVAFFSRQIVEESILPFAYKCVVTDRTPTVLMAVVGVCDVISKKFGEDLTAQKLIPVISGISMDRNLSKEQFDTYMTIFRGMLDRIAQTRYKIFEQAQNSAPSQRKLEDFERFQQLSSIVSDNRTPSPQPPAATAKRSAEQPVDSEKAGAFAELIEKQERMRQQATEQRRGSSLLSMDEPFAANLQSQQAPPTSVDIPPIVFPPAAPMSASNPLSQATVPDDPFEEFVGGFVTMPGSDAHAPVFVPPPTVASANSNLMDGFDAFSTTVATKPNPPSTSATTFLSQSNGMTGGFGAFSNSAASTQPAPVIDNDLFSQLSQAIGKPPSNAASPTNTNNTTLPKVGSTTSSGNGLLGQLSTLYSQPKPAVTPEPDAEDDLFATKSAYQHTAFDAPFMTAPARQAFPAAKPPGDDDEDFFSAIRPQSATNPGAVSDFPF